MKRQNSDRLGAEGRSWSQGKIRVFTPPPGAEEARSQLRGVRIHTEKEKELIRLKEFWSKSLFHFETGGRGHVLTLLFGTCQSGGQAANREWADAKEEEGAYWAFGPEEASQPMGLWKELARLRQQVIS